MSGHVRWKWPLLHYRCPHMPSFTCQVHSRHPHSESRNPSSPTHAPLISPPLVYHLADAIFTPTQLLPTLCSSHIPNSLPAVLEIQLSVSIAKLSGFGRAGLESKFSPV